MNKKSDFDKALQDCLDAISTRNIDKYRKYITKDNELYTIVQNGHAFQTSQELIAMHEEWFKDQNWIWEGTVIRKVVGTDIAFVLIKYEYRSEKKNTPVSTWLTWIFQLEDNEWRLIHDQNTAQDFHAFMKSAGSES